MNLILHRNKLGNTEPGDGINIVGAEFFNYRARQLQNLWSNVEKKPGG